MNQRPARRPGDRTYRPHRRITRPWRVLIPPIPRPRTGPASSLILVIGFVGLIVVGTVLLMLPIASQSGDTTPLQDALFTATSSVCVTGLVVADTADYWSGFGQAVIFVLIQAGGFGFMTSATLFLLAFGRRIGLRERLLISESMGLERIGGLTTIVKRMAVFTLGVELAGAVLFVFRFSGDMSWGKAVWTSVFHSVSSFNNAGFDLFGGFRSLTGYAGDPYVLLLTAVLVITGGISFLVVADVFGRRNWTRFSLDTKLVLSGTGVLLLGGMIVVLLTETGNPDTLGTMSFPQQLLNAFFQSVATRTAGFSTMNVVLLRDYTLFLFMLLMFIGGASGSTAGGIKINTVTILVNTIWSTVRGREHAGAFSREFTVQQVYRALAVIIISLTIIAFVVFVLTVTEDLPFLDLLFETFSAFGTVGLSTGITPVLSVAGKIIITLTMFIGRLGPLALVLSLVQRQKSSAYRFPEEPVRIG